MRGDDGSTAAGYLLWHRDRDGLPGDDAWDERDGEFEGDMDEKDLSEVHKAEIAIKIAEADKCLIDSADESLQLLMVCSLVLKCFRSN